MDSERTVMDNPWRIWKVILGPVLIPKTALKLSIKKENPLATLFSLMGKLFNQYANAF